MRCAASLCLWVALAPLGAAAQGEPPAATRDLSTDLKTVTIERATLRVPSHWRVGNLGEANIQSMVARTLTLTSPDDRLQLHILLIDPFGLDPAFTAVDVLGPTLAELLVQAGAKDSEVREMFEFSCEVGEDTSKGRLVNVQFERATADPLIKEPRLISGVACGMSRRDSWAAFFLILDTDNTRPVLLRQLLGEARLILKSFKLN
jgi:hypothetical protein